VLPAPYQLPNRHSLSALPPPDKTRIRALQPSAAYPTPDPSILVGLEPSACRRLISHDYSPHGLISLIEDILGRKDEVKIVGDLGKDAAQAFVNVVHGVRSVVLHMRHDLIARPLRFLRFRTFTSYQSGFRSVRFPLTAQKEVFERFMLDMRPPCFASGITENPGLLRSIRHPVVLRWVWRRVEGRAPGLPRRSQSTESLLDERLWQDHKCKSSQPAEIGGLVH